MTKMKEKKLVDKVRRKKDPEAFKILYDTFQQKVYHKIVRRVPSTEEAEDLKQEVFLKLWNYIISNDREIEYLSALIYKIAQNLIAEYYVNQGLVKTFKDKDKIDLDEVAWKIEDKKENIEYAVNLKMEFRELKINLDKLEPEEYRQVIELRFLEELSHREISEILDKPEGSVRVLLHRAIKKLQSIMDI
ncbi:MAG: RNA polymerase sigma factor [Patescibacteria group bacterium]